MRRLLNWIYIIIKYVSSQMNSIFDLVIIVLACV